MDGSFRRDFFAIAVGTFLGAVFAHSLGYFWYLGVVCGGFIGYMSRLLAEPQVIVSAGKRAWHIATSLHLPENWQERVMSGFYQGVCIGTCAGIFLGLVMVLANISDHGKTAANFGVNTTLGLYTWLVFGEAFVLIIVASFLFLCDGKTFGYHYQKIASWKKWAIRLNPVSIHLLAVYYLLVGLAYALSCTLWSLVWTMVHIPDFILGMVKLAKTLLHFAKLFFKFVHAERFTACGVYASVGAFLVFISVPNQPLAILASSVLCGHIGAGIRHLILPYLNGIPATK